MASLITVTDVGFGLSQRLIQGAEHKINLQGVVEFPTNDVARVPVQDRNEIDPPFLQTDIGDVDAPDVIGAHTGQVTQ